MQPETITYDEQQDAARCGYPETPLLPGEHFRRDANGVWWLVWPRMDYQAVDKTGQAEALARWIEATKEADAVEVDEEGAANA